MNRRNLWILGLVAVLAVSPALARKDLRGIEGGEFLVPTDITADGSKMVLTTLFGGGGFTWTASEGLVQISAEGCSGQLKMSSDGSTIVGNVVGSSGACEAARWDGGMNWTAMGGEPGGLPCGDSLSNAYDTNNTTAVGLFWRPQLCRAIGGTWNVLAGMAGPVLESTVPNRPTRGNGITDDGSVVVGWQDQEDGFRAAVKWVNGVQETILDDQGRLLGEAIGTNSNATVIWGTSWPGNQGFGDGRGWLFRAGKGFTPMGQGGLGRNIQSVPLGATEDGSVVIGITRDFDQFVETGWIWTAKRGWQLFDDYLKGQAGRGWQGVIPTVISDDGRYIGGRGINPSGGFQAFVLDTQASGNPN